MHGRWTCAAERESSFRSRDPLRWQIFSDPNTTDLYWWNADTEEWFWDQFGTDIADAEVVPKQANEALYEHAAADFGTARVGETHVAVEERREDLKGADVLDEVAAQDAQVVRRVQSSFYRWWKFVPEMSGGMHGRWMCETHMKDSFHSQHPTPWKTAEAWNSKELYWWNSDTKEWFWN